jgi:DNA-directed RNA polymerase subunit RPC12/RpoP
MDLKCMRCGHDLIIGGNFMLSEVTGTELDEDDDAMVTNASCPHCGASYELYDTPENEKPNYPYWDDMEITVD